MSSPLALPAAVLFAEHPAAAAAATVTASAAASTICDGCLSVLCCSAASCVVSPVCGLRRAGSSQVTQQRRERTRHSWGGGRLRPSCREYSSLRSSGMYKGPIDGFGCVHTRKSILRWCAERMHQSMESTRRRPSVPHAMTSHTVSGSREKGLMPSLVVPRLLLPPAVVSTPGMASPPLGASTPGGGAGSAVAAGGGGMRPFDAGLLSSGTVRGAEGGVGGGGGDAGGKAGGAGGVRGWGMAGGTGGVVGGGGGSGGRRGSGGSGGGDGDGGRGDGGGGEGGEGGGRGGARGRGGCGGGGASGGGGAIGGRGEGGDGDGGGVGGGAGGGGQYPPIGAGGSGGGSSGGGGVGAFMIAGATLVIPPPHVQHTCHKWDACHVSTESTGRHGGGWGERARRRGRRVSICTRRSVRRGQR